MKQVGTLLWWHLLLFCSVCKSSTLSSRHPLDTGKHKLRSLPNHRLWTSAFFWYFFQFIIDSIAVVCCFWDSPACKNTFLHIPSLSTNCAFRETLWEAAGALRPCQAWGWTQRLSQPRFLNWDLQPSLRTKRPWSLTGSVCAHVTQGNQLGQGHIQHLLHQGLKLQSL